MSGFARFVGIDWSGSGARWQRGIAVAECELDGPCRLVRPGGRHWTRSAVAEYLSELPRATLVGMDFAFSLPWPVGGPLPSTLPQPGDAFALWAEIDRICAAERDLYAGPIYRPEGGHLAAYMFTKLTGAALWAGAEFAPSRLRLTETRLTPAPNSPFRIVGAKTVGPGSFAGMRVLHHLRERLGPRLRVWPFEAADPGRITLCEIYPSSFYRGRRRRRDREAVEDAVGQHGGAIDGGWQSQDEADALVSAAALRSLARDPAWLARPPAVIDVLRREGWIFGVRLP